MSEGDKGMLGSTVEECVTEAVCTHGDVKSKRCHLHYGWCGVCSNCGKRVHARYDEFVKTGKMVFRETKFHVHEGMRG